MEKIEAIIRPFKSEGVREILSAMGIHGATITEVRVHGRQKGDVRLSGGSNYGIELLPMVKLELVVADEDKAGTVAAILRAAKTGKVGDGRIFVSPVVDAIRIRTAEHGANAV